MPRSLNGNSVFVLCTAFVVIDIFNILLVFFYLLHDSRILNSDWSMSSQICNLYFTCPTTKEAVKSPIVYS